MADVTPRINGADRPHFANQTVRFIGRLEGVRPASRSAGVESRTAALTRLGR